jgi:hypothetical protein
MKKAVYGAGILALSIGDGMAVKVPDCNELA